MLTLPINYQEPAKESELLNCTQALPTSIC